MYWIMKDICSSESEVSGPALDAEKVLTDPTLSEDCLDHITSVPRKQFSRYVSRMMDRLGYSYTMIKERQTMCHHCDRNFARNLIRVTTGGKGEGTSLLYESDRDVMFVCKNIVSTNRPQDYIHNMNITLFQTETQNSSSGYTRLKLVRLNEAESEVVRNSLFVSENGSRYISSTFYNSEIIADLENDIEFNMSIGAISGPSTPCLNYSESFDFVDSFICICDEYLENWVSRPRYHGWPTTANIRHISRLDGHVVPVGFKGSENYYREWRICYSLAELHLIRTFNECQLKVYVILKKMSKSVLNPVCSDITSYIMKNVVFWVSEEHGIEGFTEDFLVDRLLDCIKYLRKCIKKKILPSYMIPERNLFAGRLDNQQRHQLTGLLSDLLKEGGKMLLRFDTFREAMVIMYISPDMLREFAEIRDKIESLCLVERRIRCETLRRRMTEDQKIQLLSQNDELCDINRHIDYLMKFNTRVLTQQGKTDEEINDLYIMRLKELLS